MPIKRQSPATFSTREAARLLGVSVRTVQIWVEEERLQAWKTPGGHRRILVSSLQRVRAENGLGSAGDSPALLLLDRLPARRESLLRQLGASLPDANIETAADMLAMFLAIGRRSPDILVIDQGSVSPDAQQAFQTLANAPGLGGMLVLILCPDGMSIQSLPTHLPANYFAVVRREDPAEMVQLIQVFLQGRQAANPKG